MKEELLKQWMETHHLKPNEVDERLLLDLIEFVLKNKETPTEVSGNHIDFEKDLFALINRYAQNGLSKPDLVSKMKWATGNCEKS